MISIAIDGPAGAGKSTISRMVAADIGFLYVDTGALYLSLIHIFNPYSNGELVKSKTLNEWRTHDGVDIKADIATPDVYKRQVWQRRLEWRFRVLRSFLRRCGIFWLSHAKQVEKLWSLRNAK